MQSKKYQCNQKINILSLSSKMRSQRVLLGLRQDELGDLLGITRHYVGRIENGKVPSRKIEAKIEQWLKSAALRSGERFAWQVDEEAEEDQESSNQVNEEKVGYYSNTLNTEEVRLRCLADKLGVDYRSLLKSLVDAAEREIMDTGGLRFPVRLASLPGEQSSDAGEKEA